MWQEPISTTPNPACRVSARPSAASPMAEQVTLNHWVRGSNPWRRTESAPDLHKYPTGSRSGALSFPIPFPVVPSLACSEHLRKRRATSHLIASQVDTGGHRRIGMSELVRDMHERDPRLVQQRCDCAPESMGHGPRGARVVKCSAHSLTGVGSVPRDLPGWLGVRTEEHEPGPAHLRPACSQPLQQPCWKGDLPQSRH